MQSTVLILGAHGRFGLAGACAFRDAGWRVLQAAQAALAAPGLSGNLQPEVSHAAA